MKRVPSLKLLGLVTAFLFLGFMGFAQNIEFWSWNNEGAYPAVHEDAQKRFEADHPGVTVQREYISYGDYMVKVKAVLSGGEAPDVLQSTTGRGDTRGGPVRQDRFPDRRSEEGLPAVLPQYHEGDLRGRPGVVRAP